MTSAVLVAQKNPTVAVIGPMVLFIFVSRAAIFFIIIFFEKCANALLGFIGAVFYVGDMIRVILIIYSTVKSQNYVTDDYFLYGVYAVAQGVAFVFPFVKFNSKVPLHVDMAKRYGFILTFVGLANACIVFSVASKRSQLELANASMLFLSTIFSLPFALFLMLQVSYDFGDSNDRELVKNTEAVLHSCTSFWNFIGLILCSFGISAGEKSLVMALIVHRLVLLRAAGFFCFGNAIGALDGAESGDPPIELDLT